MLSPAQEITTAKESSPAERAALLADKLLGESLRLRTVEEEAEMKRLAGLVSDPNAKRLSMIMTDVFWRSKSYSRTGRCLRSLLEQVGKIAGFGRLDRWLLSVAGFASRFLPQVVVRSIRHRLKTESAKVIIPAEASRFAGYLRGRQTEGVRTNINPLGAAVLGEGEAQLRCERIVALLERPDVSYVSVKLSSIYSQMSNVAWDATLETLKEKLRALYLVAKREQKFINLDMEEYRDLQFTMEAFRSVLGEPEFLDLSAGIVLQAYLPDSITAQRDLTAWAMARRRLGGADIKIRIVKGANLAMEHVDAEWHGWNSAPYPSKEATDAAFKRMLEFACQPAHASAVRVGIGSHNLFDIALALTLARDANVEDAVEIEMLEGMAAPQARAVLAEAGNLLVYSPIVRDEDYGSALAYLVRRLDENTSPGNFLADLFDLHPNSEAWKGQRQRFYAAWKDRRHVNEISHRASLPERDLDAFSNEPDTDWTQSKNRLALQRAQRSSNSLSLPPSAYRATIQQALAESSIAQQAWEREGYPKRAAVLMRCAQLLAEQRFQSIDFLNRHGKKAVPEADTEVSEAIDFARYYAEICEPFPGTQAQALGIVVIAPPWNFPYAIPCGGILAALVAGNAVILKPAPEATEIGWHLVNQLWDAGVPRSALQFVHCEDGEVGKSLITDPRTAAVVLTGGYETARMFREWRPSLPLFAETSGKNAILVSGMADRELAARDLVRSAFSHAGQKCSAASLGILETEVYHDPIFRRQLRDAAASLPVGPSSDLTSVVTPLIQEPGKRLLRALTQLDEGEEWLLEPKQDTHDPLLWSPGIKLGVTPRSWFHQTECFGPVLGLMCASNLKGGVSLQNDVRFGLTAGIHSLDADEISSWKEHVQAGNLYINRGITGAIVRRQPFGGWKDSNVGPGAKAGGPNYVNLFRVQQDEESVTLECAAQNYKEAWENHFALSSNPSKLQCESNLFRYRPRQRVILRLPEADVRSEGLATLASERTGVPLTISRASEEPAERFIQRLRESEDGTVLRTLGNFVEEEVISVATGAKVKWIDAPLSAIGRLELTRWMDEQAVCETRHRYGNTF